MANPTVLTREQLLPVVVCLMRRQDATAHRINLRPLLPPCCPTCGAAPTDIVDSVDPTLYRPARLHFRPCGHEFTASDEDILGVWDVARGILDEQQNRPAGERVHAPCPQVHSRERHDAHDWFAPVDGRARCLGYDAEEERVKEPAPPQTLAERVRDLEYTLQRVRETVGTDQPAEVVSDQRDDEMQLLRNEIGWLRERIGLMRSSLCEAFGVPDDEAIDVIGSAREQLAEARNWARHGFEIGQRHCGWSDHGVAPAWLTEGWPRSFDSCEHSARAAEYDTALTKVRGLSETPEIMDAQHPDPSGYLHGYKAAIGDAKHAARTDQEERPS